MTCAEIRKLFLDIFASKQHQIVSSAPIVVKTTLHSSSPIHESTSLKIAFSETKKLLIQELLLLRKIYAFVENTMISRNRRLRYISPYHIWNVNATEAFVIILRLRLSLGAGNCLLKFINLIRAILCNGIRRRFLRKVCLFHQLLCLAIAKGVELACKRMNKRGQKTLATAWLDASNLQQVIEKIKSLH